MNLPDPTEVMRLAEKMMRDSWATGHDAAWQPARDELLAAVRTYGAACAAAAEPSEWQLLALAFDDVRSGANLLPAQRSAAINLGRRRWEAFRAAGGIGSGG